MLLGVEKGSFYIAFIYHLYQQVISDLQVALLLGLSSNWFHKRQANNERGLW